MGRRPNQLVHEFFERGQKLPDASNRYAHTCKRCGEMFPKGRLDSMMGHIQRRCPNMTQQDRDMVFIYTQSNPARPPSTAQNQRQSDTAINSLPITSQPPPLPQAAAPDMTMHTGSPSPASLAMYEVPQSALGMLAEVSRRHLDYSSQRGQYLDGHEQVMNDEGQMLAEQALMLQLQQVSRGTAQLGPAVTEDPGLFMYAAEVPMPQAERKFEFQTLPTTASSPYGVVDTSSHIDIVTGPAQQIGPGLHHTQGPTIDPLLGIAPAPALQAFDAPVAEFMTWNPTTLAGRQTFGTLSALSNEPTPGFGMLQTPVKRPVRGHFTDTRRKEVQEIRKRGACIRCRMLKKPCSEGTPCNTCANIESARLWKGTCIRTRLADELTLWSTGLFDTRAKSEVSAAVQDMLQFVLPGRIEARVISNSDLCMTFAVKQYTAPTEPSQGLDPNLHEKPRNETCIWVLDEDANMCEKIEEYVHRVAQARVNTEGSPFLKATLQQALDLLQEEKSALASMASEPQAGRSSYNLQTQLLKNTVELWAGTCFLSSCNELDLSLHYNTNKAPQHLPESVSWSNNEQHTHIDPTSLSFSLIRNQLLAAIESRCSKLAKTVINELERRLLQRQQVSRFSTFISAVVLLNCVERVTGFYRAFDNNEAFASAFGITTWPLDENPSKLWPEGESFAKTLIILLRMRALPPKTLRNSGGQLIAMQDHTLPVHLQGRPVKEQVDDQIKAAAAWLDPIQLDVRELAAKESAPVPGIGDGLEAWDLRFLSKVLLPEATVS